MQRLSYLVEWGFSFPELPATLQASNSPPLPDLRKCVPFLVFKSISDFWKLQTAVQLRCLLREELVYCFCCYCCWFCLFLKCASNLGGIKVRIKMDAKLMCFLSPKSKLVRSKRKSLTAREELFESCLGSPKGERGFLMSPDPEVRYSQPPCVIHPVAAVEQTDPSTNLMGPPSAVNSGINSKLLTWGQHEF